MSFLYSSSVAEDEAVVAGRVEVDEIIATNSSASTRYFQIFDSATVPADTAVPLFSIAVAAGTTAVWDPTAGRFGTETFAAGIAVCLSSTLATKTVTTADEAFFAIRGRLSP